MNETNNEELVVQEPEQNNAEEKHVEIKDEQPKESPKNDSNQNWEQARQLLQLQKQRIEELEARAAQQMQAVSEEEKDEFNDLDPNDYMTVGKAKELAVKLASKEAAKIAKQVVNEHLQQQTIVNDEQRARAKYQDFDYVIENFAIPMIKNDPALAYKIQNSKNPAEVAYKLAKISDEYEVETMKAPNNAKAEKILKNSSRPVSSAAATVSLKNQSEIYANKSKQEIWEESQKYAKKA